MNDSNLPAAEPALSAEVIARDDTGAEVRAKHAAINENAKNIVLLAVEIGNLLIESEQHGNFQRWVKDQCGFSQDTAENYMKVARAVRQNPSAIGFSTIRRVLAYVYHQKRGQPKQKSKANTKSTVSKSPPKPETADKPRGRQSVKT